jgi:hypothetical protein
MTATLARTGMHLGSYRGAGLENPGCLETQFGELDWLLRITRAGRYFGMLLDKSTSSLLQMTPFHFLGHEHIVFYFTL